MRSMARSDPAGTGKRARSFHNDSSSATSRLHSAQLRRCAATSAGSVLPWVSASATRSRICSQFVIGNLELVNDAFQFEESAVHAHTRGPLRATQHDAQLGVSQIAVPAQQERLPLLVTEASQTALDQVEARIRR